tara:strand:+ start:47291 stop:48070 length:780 start_codon:yes stop_codon:yes gene_type:complete
MEQQELKKISDELYQSLRTGVAVSPLTERFPAITIDDAYKVSLNMLAMREADGERLIGKKIGVTSEAVQNMLNVRQPDFGFLTDKMQFSERLSLTGMIAPKAEGEIAFRLKSDLKGPGVSEADVLAATDYIMPCFEIVDSRIANWAIKIQDTVADNASCGSFVVSEAHKVDPRELDLPALEMKVYKNGQLLSEGLGAAALGNPLSCVAWLANTLGEYGISLLAGDIILSGSLVPLEPIKAGDEMSLEISGVGSLAVVFE